jgi:hypothetical protein
LPNLRIPERYRPGLSVLANLTDTEFRELLAAAVQAPSTFASYRDLAVWIADGVRTVNSGELTKVVDSIASLHRLLSRPGVTPSKLASDATVAVGDIQGFKILEGVDFSERLSALLELSCFNIVAIKAKELQSLCERTVCDTRILTDVRPIYGESTVNPPTGMIVIHTLKIGYHDSGTGRHKEFYVALDDSDIAELRKALDRATEKTQSLKPVIEKTGVRLIDLT